MERTESQKKAILSHMRVYGFIEPLTALREYGCMRLASRITDLRNDGHNIRKSMMSSTSKITGQPVHFAKYELVE